MLDEVFVALNVLAEGDQQFTAASDTDDKHKGTRVTPTDSDSSGLVLERTPGLFDIGRIVKTKMSTQCRLFMMPVISRLCRRKKYSCLNSDSSTRTLRGWRFESDGFGSESA